MHIASTPQHNNLTDKRDNSLRRSLRSAGRATIRPWKNRTAADFPTLVSRTYRYHRRRNRPCPGSRGPTWWWLVETQRWKNNKINSEENTGVLLAAREWLAGRPRSSHGCVTPSRRRGGHVQPHSHKKERGGCSYCTTAVRRAEVRQLLKNKIPNSYNYYQSKRNNAALNFSTQKSQCTIRLILAEALYTWSVITLYTG